MKVQVESLLAYFIFKALKHCWDLSLNFSSIQVHLSNRLILKRKKKVYPLPQLSQHYMVIYIFLLFTVGCVQWQGTQSPIWDCTVPKFHLLDRIYERLHLPAGTGLWWSHSAEKWKTSSVWAPSIWCTKPAG